MWGIAIVDAVIYAGNPAVKQYHSSIQSMPCSDEHSSCTLLAPPSPCLEEPLQHKLQLPIKGPVNKSLVSQQKITQFWKHTMCLKTRRMSMRSSFCALDET